MPLSAVNTAEAANLTSNILHFALPLGDVGSVFDRENRKSNFRNIYIIYIIYNIYNINIL